MRTLLMAALFGFTLFGGKAQAQNNSPVAKTDITNVYGFTVKNINGEEISLEKFKGKVLLIVNVASECGFTPQYEGLENIYENFKDKGFEILAFPCNDFGGQEPGTNEQIKEFCSTKFGVTFKLFDKISVKGDSASPLFKMLTNNTVTGKSAIKWNFEKFLIDQNGFVVKRWRSTTKPESSKITSAIKTLLE